jgi:DNA-directed RNA polymerase specialized sigma subunit
MKNSKFSETLRAAIAGDRDAAETILLRYMPLINKRSRIDGVIDEDLRQYIMMRVIERIPKFDPDLVR